MLAEQHHATIRIRPHTKFSYAELDVSEIQTIVSPAEFPLISAWENGDATAIEEGSSRALWLVDILCHTMPLYSRTFLKLLLCGLGCIVRLTRRLSASKTPGMFLVERYALSCLLLCISSDSRDTYPRFLNSTSTSQRHLENPHPCCAGSRTSSCSPQKSKR